MGLWSFYFLAKVFLFFRGAIAFHALPNFLLAFFISAPWLFHTRTAPRIFGIAHRILCPVLALAVFWNDSFLPPFDSAVEFVANPATRPTPIYMVSFLLGYWHTVTIGLLVVLLLITILANRRGALLTPVVLFGMIVAGIQNASLGAPETVDEEVTRFFGLQANSDQRIRLEPPSTDSPPFDIVFLHVCSMSWDDLAHARLVQHPFLTNFDYLLTRFNTVTSYSGPATLRLLRAPCGQVSHSELYDDVPEECSLMGSLRRGGFSPYTLFNSRGNLPDVMAETAERLGRAAPLEPLPEPRIESVSFDGAPVYNNYDRLAGWWKRRLASGQERAVLYYNSMTLHVGVHTVGEPRWWSRDLVKHYKSSALQVFDDYLRFFDLLEKSGRDVMVVMVPEHGAALVGNQVQGRDLRDIPLPLITTVPVGLKFIGNFGTKEPARLIDKPTSYTAIAYLVNEALRARDAQLGLPISRKSLAGIPETPFLSDNQNSRVVAHKENFYFKERNGRWVLLAKNLYPEPPSVARDQE